LSRRAAALVAASRSREHGVSSLYPRLMVANGTGVRLIVASNLRRLFRFDGRDCRLHYWIYLLTVLCGLFCVLAIAMVLAFGVLPALGYQESPDLYLAVGALSMAVSGALLAAATVRRLRDGGRSSDWVVLPVAPGTVFLALIVAEIISDGLAEEAWFGLFEFMVALILMVTLFALALLLLVSPSTAVASPQPGGAGVSDLAATPPPSARQPNQLDREHAHRDDKNTAVLAWSGILCGGPFIPIILVVVNWSNTASLIRRHALWACGMWALTFGFWFPICLLVLAQDPPATPEDVGFPWLLTAVAGLVGTPLVGTAIGLAKALGAKPAPPAGKR
jgi:uncharacterized membrane protein YhaH (DUF805 family)